MEQNTHIDKLGHTATDAVTGFTGVITSVSFDLYGCVQAVVTPKVDEKGETPQGKWFDIVRLKLKAKKKVLPTPDFAKGYIAEGKKGCADKPLP